MPGHTYPLSILPLCFSDLAARRSVARALRRPHRLYSLLIRHERRGLVVFDPSPCRDGQSHRRRPHVVGRLQDEDLIIVPEGQEVLSDGNPELLEGWPNGLEAVLRVID